MTQPDNTNTTPSDAKDELERDGSVVIEVCGKAHYWDKLVEKYGLGYVIALLEADSLNLSPAKRVEATQIDWCKPQRSDNESVERVARAIMIEQQGNYSDDWERWIPEAKVAISAMLPRNSLREMGEDKAVEIMFGAVSSSCSNSNEVIFCKKLLRIAANALLTAIQNSEADNAV